MSGLALNRALAGAPRFSAAQLLDLAGQAMHEVEARLQAHMQSTMGNIPEVGGHLLGAGGKRLRPLLAILAGRAADASLPAAISVGCAAELIHTATLFHDDVVDNGTVRRGRPAARMVYGNGIAVLVGDYCFARGLESVADTGSLVAVKTLADAVTEMAEGEVAQMEGAGDCDATVENYLDIIDRKTGSLMTWCARVGGILPKPFDAALARYGRFLGRAFQITDDLIDCDTDVSVSGKSPGRDLQEGKLTLPMLLACAARPDLRVEVRSAMGETGLSPEQALRILKAARAAGGFERARVQAVDFAASAVAELDALPLTEFRDGLAALAHLAVDRVA
jgi:octaprenyl-diphosphate synthase